MWKLIHDNKLRVLAAHYDNPFSSAQARRNLDTALSKLGVDCIKWGFEDGYHIRETKKALQAWSKKPSVAMMPIMCSVCKGWWPEFFRIAREHDISLIVVDSYPLETASFKETSFGGARNQGCQERS